jgi:hypothetical protein
MRIGDRNHSYFQYVGVGSEHGLQGNG